MYAIVKFIDEYDAPGIVCSHWITKEENLCYYPNVRTNEARDKLLRKLAQPGNDWTSCPIKILRKCSSFSEANMYLPRAEETSNLESEEETANRNRRKLKRYNKIVYSEDESDEDCGSTSKRVAIDPYPNPPEYYSSTQPQHQPPIQPSPSNFHSQPQHRPPIPPSPTPNLHSEKPAACSSSQTIFNGRITAWMADISDKIKQLDEKMDIIISNQNKVINSNQPPASLDRQEDIELLGKLPVTDDGSFMDLNEKLAEQSHLRHLMIKVLLSVGGKDMRCHIHNMLRRILSDEVAEIYSLSGKSTLKDTVKKCFLDTEVSKAIFGACQRAFKDSTEVKIKEAVGDWLNQAKVRKNRRMQRHERMEKSAENNLLNC